MSYPSEVVQEEISVRELMEVIWKGKVFIAIVTAIGVFVSAIVSFFIISEKYDAYATLAVTPITIKLSTLDNEVSIVDYLAMMPIRTKADYFQQIKTSQVINDTIQKLSLKDSSGNYISANSLSSAITVTDIANTDRIQIVVNDKDPEKAALIANTLGQAFGEYVSINTKEQIQRTADVISEQTTNEEKNLLEKKQALNDYRTQNINLDMLKEEEKSLITLLANYNTDALALETQITSDKSALKVLESAAQSNDIISSDEYNISIDLSTVPDSIGEKQMIIQPDSLANSLLTIDISNIQTRIVNNTSKQITLENRIPELEIILNELQTSITDAEYIYNTVNSDMEVAQLNYAAYQQRSREVSVYTSFDVSSNIISTTSEASIPGQPTTPNRIRNIAVAGVFGLCLGVFIVLFRNYWKRGKVNIPK